MHIESISEVRSRAGRYEIRIDDGEINVLSAREIGELGLVEGMQLTAPQLQRVQVAAGHLATYDRALGMLSRASRSRFDLRRRLLAKGEAPVHVAHALDRLEREGVCDDYRYAEQVARSRMRRGWTRSRVLSYLLRTGVERSTADEAVRTVSADEGLDESELVLGAARQRWKTLAHLEPTAARRRLMGFLQRRGFGAADIRAALAALQAEAGKGN